MDVSIAPLFGDDYVARLYTGKLSYTRVLLSYVTRLKNMLRAGQFDLVWVEKEMLPWVPSWFELGLFPASVSLVVDYDDALFHRYDRHRWPLVRRFMGKKIDAVMQRADLVLAGNDYLAQRARSAGARRIELLPTVVDVSRYTVSERTIGTPLTIGWIGSPSTAPYLMLIKSVLRDLVASRDVRVVAVGANVDQLEGLPVEVTPWDEAREVKEIQQFDIGIMPLPDEPFERGKCGYKLIQYMACSKPVVASPVGVNREIVEQGVNGFLANSHEEWLTALVRLLDNAELREQMGGAGRKRIEDKYCTQQVAPRLATLLRTAVDRVPISK
ncbi:MAG: glycosyltransferase family 4 protein [Halothiobacillus sp.]|jgi:glycosyltransferase involved in cell wall biosynthesis|nr:glycosyltransferase family 4 protein [Halothiobacillus sp.]